MYLYMTYFINYINQIEKDSKYKQIRLIYKLIYIYIRIHIKLIRVINILLNCLNELNL
jgi:hypothetical protein